MDSTTDIAILRLTSDSVFLLEQNSNQCQTKRKPLIIRRKADNSTLKNGTKICIWGYPGDLDLTFVQGCVSNKELIMEEDGQQRRLIQVNAVILKGNSGSPAFDTAGDLLGIVSSKYAAQPGIGLVIPVEDIEKHIQIVFLSHN